MISACAWAGCQELARGVLTPSVPCRAKPGQSYALYLPRGYSEERSWPILYCLDPVARGRLPVERFAEAAERARFIVAGSNNSRNGPMEPVREAIESMVADTQERFKIDQKRVYAAGFSGGARLALGWGLGGKLAGVVACGAAFGPNGPPKQIPFQLYLAAGIDDFNFDEMRQASAALGERGTPHRFAVFDGTHEWLPKGLAAEALEFFAGNVAANAATDTKPERKQAARYQYLCGQVAALSAIERPALVEQLRKDAAKPADSPDRRIARRVLGATVVTAMEQARPLIEAKEYKRAAALLEIALLARPDAPEMWFTLAQAQAGAGDSKQALRAVEQAIAKGFNDGGRLDRDPLLSAIRATSRYRELRSSMH